MTMSRPSPHSTLARSTASCSTFQLRTTSTAVEIPEASILGVLPRGDTPEELGMLFEKGSPLVSCVNDALATLHDNGTIEGLEDEWLNSGGSIP